jgi:hypothetical protein
MAALAYTTARQVPATKADGGDCLLCIAFVRHENGFTERVAINEEFLRWASGGDSAREIEVIEREIAVATAR